MSVDVIAPPLQTTATTQARRLATFSVLSAVAVIAWHAQSQIPFQRDWRTAGFVIALVVLVRPFSRMAFLSLAMVETMAVLIALPATNTNRLLQLFVFASIASTGLYALARSGFRRLDYGAWLEPFQPLLRLQLVIVYGLAAWHKLNLDFFNPQLSCAVVLVENAPFAHLQVNGNALRWGLILGTIVSEMALPVLLSLRRTRNFAICYGVLFHIVLGLSGFYAFSITMISLLFLFSPDDFCDVAAEFWRGRTRLVKTIVAIGGPTIVAASIALTAATFGPALAQVQQTRSVLGGLNMTWEMVVSWSTYWMLLLYLLPLGLFVCLWYWQPAAFQPAAHSYRPIPAVFWVIPALLIFDGINPYLGLKTDTAFAMYSNLRSEGGSTNHLIWRRPLALASYQEDLVRVVDSNVPALQAVAQRDLPITFYDLRRLVSGRVRSGGKNISVTYVRNGTTVRVDAAESDTELSAPPSWLERKFLKFRAITREGCPH